MSDFFEKFVADLVKGAQASEGFVRGSSVGVEVAGDRGREQKLANHAGLGGALAGPLGAAIGADPGQGWQAAGGSLLGGTGGALLGHAAGSMISPQAAMIARAIGSMAGSGIGGHIGGHDDRNAVQRTVDKMSALEETYVRGAAAAAARMGVKEAFLPLLGAIAGPMAARAGLGALGRGIGGKALQGVASKVMPRIGGGIGGAAFDAAASLGGGALGQKLEG